MKRISVIALLLCMVSIGTFARGKKPIALKQLPDPVKKEVLKNFKKDSIQLITAEREFRNYEYTFIMTDGTKVEYDKNAQLRSIKNANGVPDKFLPKEIKKYLKSTLPHAIVTEYEKESLCQKVELNNDMELVFNNKGQFLRIDD